MNYLLVLMGGLQISDGIMTDVLVRGNIATEGNPLMEAPVDAGYFLILKIAGAVICVFILKLLSKRFRRTAFLTGSISALIYLAVMTWNTGTLLV